MKRFFLLPMVALVILLTGCSKGGINSSNALIGYYELENALLGKNLDEGKEIMAKYGWTFTHSYNYGNYYVFSKTANGVAAEATLGIDLDGANKIYNILITTNDASTITKNTSKDFLTYLGDSPKLSNDVVCSFIAYTVWSKDTTRNSVYSDMMNDFDEMYSGGCDVWWRHDYGKYEAAEIQFIISKGEGYLLQILDNTLE